MSNEKIFKEIASDIKIWLEEDKDQHKIRIEEYKKHTEILEKILQEMRYQRGIIT